MHRLLAIFLTLCVALSLATAVAGPAEAKRKKRDTPGCVSKYEYRAVHRGLTQAQIAALFDTWGVEVANDDDGYWADSSYYTGAWVEDGYTEYDGYYDSRGSWVETTNWVDTSYYDEYAGYVEQDSWNSMLDTVRSYKKCKSFQRGRGRVGIEFDNYSYGSDLRVFTITANNPASLYPLVYLRTTARTMGHGKPLPRH